MTKNANMPAVPEIAPANVIQDPEYATLVADLRRVYVGRDSDITVATTLENLLELRREWANRRERWREGDPDTAEVKPYECRALVITGESGAGKTTLLRKVLGAPRPGANSMPILSQQLPAPGTQLTLGRALLDKLGYPISDHAKEHVVWDTVRRQLALADVDILHLDEVQNITGRATRKDARKLLDGLRARLIDAEHPVILVLSGLPEIAPFLAGDTQIRRRADFMALETLTPEDIPTLTEVLNNLGGKANLEVDHEGDLVPRLMHAAGRQFGTAMEMCVEAALRAVRPVDAFGTRLPRERRLGRSHFGAVYAGRSGNAPFANPFLAQDWHLVDTTLVQITHPAQIPSRDDEPPPRQRSRKPKPKAGRR